MQFINSETKKILEMIEHADKLYDNYTSRSIDKESPYSLDINKFIKSFEELNIYKSLNLKEGFITRKALIADIDVNYYDYSKQETNLDKMLAGLPPIDVATMQSFDLHHIGQGYDAPFAELPKLAHIGVGNYGVLHPIFIESWRLNGQLINNFARERAEYWRRRGELLSGQGN